ncbi:MAG: CPBP family intramembrane metalloprotease [Gemmatimonadetes bacterium]|nr:CPBP family intramembrane metalloprotease [Gemmatimonadota bacterium]
MGNLNLVSFIFLVVLFVLLPRAALRSARQLRQAHVDGQAPPRLRMALSTMFSLTVLWFLAAINSAAYGKHLFSLGGLGLREVGIGVIGFALLLLTIPISRALRKPDEDRRRLIFSLAPRNAREWVVYALIAVMAGIAEESAYRGVAVWILTPIFGSPLPAMFLSAMAFGVAHAVQGAKAMAVVFFLALILQGLVWMTNTLVIAMVAHAAYDLVAGYVLSQRARELAAERVEDSAAATPG